MKKYLLLMLSIVVFCNFTKEKKETQVKSTDEFPIMAWIGVPESETTVERFRELKESGININFSSYSNIEAVEKALDVAQEAGVKLMPSFPELRTEPEKSAKRLMKHPALAGYHLTDEPGAASFPELGKWVKRIQSVDKKHGCYINLFPNYAPSEVLIGKDGVLAPGEDPYAKHVEMFLKEVPVPFLSFDYYPVVEETEYACCAEDGIRIWRLSQPHPRNQDFHFGHSRSPLPIRPTPFPPLPSYDFRCSVTWLMAHRHCSISHIGIPEKAHHGISMTPP